MYKFIYLDKKTGKNVYSHSELRNDDLKLISGVRTIDINPTGKATDVKLKSKPTFKATFKKANY